MLHAGAEALDVHGRNVLDRHHGVRVAHRDDAALQRIAAECGRQRDRVSLGARAEGRGDVPRRMERRVYNVDPLVGPRNDEHAHRLSTLEDLIRTLVAHETWDSDHRSYVYLWNGLMCISQTAEVHAEIEAFLNRILNQGRGPQDRDVAARRQLEAQLEKTIDMTYDEQPLSAVAADLSKRYRVPVVSHVPDDDAEPITLALRGVTLGDALAWVAKRAECVVDVRDHAIYLSRGEPVRLDYYRVGDLTKPRKDDVEADRMKEALADLIRSTLHPDLWDSYEQSGIHFWDDVMIVSQSETVHDRLPRFLETLRQALGG